MFNLFKQFFPIVFKWNINPDNSCKGLPGTPPIKITIWDMLIDFYFKRLELVDHVCCYSTSWSKRTQKMAINTVPGIVHSDFSEFFNPRYKYFSVNFTSELNRLANHRLNHSELKVHLTTLNHLPEFVLIVGQFHQNSWWFQFFSGH